MRELINNSVAAVVASIFCAMAAAQSAVPGADRVRPAIGTTPNSSADQAIDKIMPGTAGDTREGATVQAESQSLHAAKPDN
jgi:hypothetical protein